MLSFRGHRNRRRIYGGIDAPPKTLYIRSFWQSHGSFGSRECVDGSSRRTRRFKSYICRGRQYRDKCHCAFLDDHAHNSCFDCASLWRTRSRRSTVLLYIKHVARQQRSRPLYIDCAKQGRSIDSRRNGVVLDLYRQYNAVPVSRRRSTVCQGDGGCH